MKRKNHYIFGMIAVAATMASVSCSDFDDYNKAYTNASVESTKTLWENILGQENLSQFAEVAKKAGFDKELNSSRTYTVWAPVNGSFDYDRYINRMDSDSVRYKFIENHVANFNYAMTGEARNERVHTLNEKSYLLASSDNGVFTFDGKTMNGTGIPSVNGTLHTINGEAAFYPNIYESIFETAGSDSVVAYFNKYKREYLDTKNSIEGPIVDGKQTYIDSVMVSDNGLFRSFNAYIAREDSNYTMLLPTDKAYLEAYNRIKTCFVYPSTMQYYEVSSEYQGENPTAQSLKVETSTYTAAYLQDSIVKKNLISPLFVNNNKRENSWLVGKQTGYSIDSLVSTRSDEMSNGREMAETAMVSEPAVRSNGYVRTVDTLAYKAWELWNPEIDVPIRNGAYRPYSNTTAAVVSSVSLTEDEIDPAKLDTTIKYSNGEVYMPKSYLNFAANGDRRAPAAYFYIPNVRSTSYNIYIEFVPARYRIGATEREKNYKVDVTVKYAGSDGKVASSAVKTFKNVQTTDSSHVCRVKVGTVQFPVSYYGLDDCYPYIYVKSARSTISTKDYDKLDNNLRISRIFLRPVEYDNYLTEQNKDDEQQD